MKITLDRMPNGEVDIETKGNRMETIIYTPPNILAYQHMHETKY